MSSPVVPLKVLAIHRYYWPDTPPYASMLRSIVRRWVDDGHEVDVLSSQPSYKAALNNERQPSKQDVDGATVTRIELPPEAGRPIRRIANALKLGLCILWRVVIQKRYDVVMVSTSPPVLAGWFTALAARISGARFIYHCMDIHPEIGRISGEFSNPHVFRLLKKLDAWACRQATPVVVLSSDMAHSLEARNPSKKPATKVINNFSLPSDDSAPAALPFAWPEEPFVILFAGNIGRFQGLETLLQAMADISHRKDVCLLMMGEGAAKASLEKMAGSLQANVRFVGHHPVDVAKQAMRNATVGFVSLVPELYKYAYPSKTMTYLEQGCPVLLAVETHSQLARDIVGNHVGVAVPGGDVDQLKGVILRLADEVDDLKVMKKKAGELATVYSEAAVLDTWSALLSAKDDK